MFGGSVGVSVDACNFKILSHQMFLQKKKIIINDYLNLIF